MKIMPAKNIYHAVLYLEVETLRKFLEKDPESVNQLNERKSTVLHDLAAFAPAPDEIQRFNQIARLLIDHGANPFLRDHYDRTALDFAEQLNLYPPYIQLLREYMADYAATHANTSTTKTITPALHQRRNPTSTSTASSSTATASSTTTTDSNPTPDTDHPLQNLIQTIMTFTH
jgi:ankyrin repeat protein